MYHMLYIHHSLLFSPWNLHPFSFLQSIDIDEWKCLERPDFEAVVCVVEVDKALLAEKVGVLGNLFKKDEDIRGRRRRKQQPNKKDEERERRETNCPALWKERRDMQGGVLGSQSQRPYLRNN